MNASTLRISSDDISDSPESLFETLAKKSGAYFSVNDFPSDAINITLIRAQALATVLQVHFTDAHAVSMPEVYSGVAGALDASLRDLKVILSLWLAGADAKQQPEKAMGLSF